MCRWEGVCAWHLIFLLACFNLTFESYNQFLIIMPVEGSGEVGNPKNNLFFGFQWEFLFIVDG